VGAHSAAGRVAPFDGLPVFEHQAVELDVVVVVAGEG
jgi:hypothetical protein